MNLLITRVSSIYEQAKLSIYGIFIYLNIPIDAVKVLVIMIAIDTVLGLIKAVKLKSTITFRKLMCGMVSKVTLLTFPMILALMGKGLDYDLTSFPVIIMDILIISEGFSAFGNIQAIRTGKPVESMDIVSTLIKAIRVGLKKVLDRLLAAIGIEKE